MRSPSFCFRGMLKKQKQLKESKLRINNAMDFPPDPDFDRCGVSPEKGWEITAMAKLNVDRRIVPLDTDQRCDDKYMEMWNNSWPFKCAVCGIETDHSNHSTKHGGWLDCLKKFEGGKYAPWSQFC